jgi:tetraacyldisaccharide 4'-kinase
MIDWEKIQRKRGFNLWTPFLAPLSLVYGLGLRFRLFLHRQRDEKALPGFVVSIGNLSVGGTGKTPATCMLGAWAKEAGYRVAVLSRGYKGKSNEEVLVVSDGEKVMADSEQAGDEAYLLARKLMGVPVLISKERYAAGLKAHQDFGTNFFVLDDGFQHLRLSRDLNLVLLDASKPFGNGHLLPWGPLREPVAQLKRADAFMLTRITQGRAINDLRTYLEKRFPNRPVFQSDHVPERVVFPVGGESHDPRELKGKRLVAFSGIARNEAFRESLIALGADLLTFRSFEDHHVYEPEEILEMIAVRKNFGADCLLTTEKDWVRIEKQGLAGKDLGYLTIRFRLHDEEAAFVEMIQEKARIKLKPRA